jgi:hypothetical protein
MECDTKREDNQEMVELIFSRIDAFAAREPALQIHRLETVLQIQIRYSPTDTDYKQPYRYTD